MDNRILPFLLVLFSLGLNRQEIISQLGNHKELLQQRVHIASISKISQSNVSVPGFIIGPRIILPSVDLQSSSMMGCEELHELGEVIVAVSAEFYEESECYNAGYSCFTFGRGMSTWA